MLNSLPNDKNLDWSKMEWFSDDKTDMNREQKIVFGKSRKHCGKRRKC